MICGLTDGSISSNPAQGVYTWGRMELLLVLHVALGGMVLAPNHPAPREQSGRGFGGRNSHLGPDRAPPLDQTQPQQISIIDED